MYRCMDTCRERITSMGSRVEYEIHTYSMQVTGAEGPRSRTKRRIERLLRGISAYESESPMRILT